eukprot:745708-Hanusia_phi.AAC.8
MFAKGNRLATWAQVTTKVSLVRMQKTRQREMLLFALSHRRPQTASKNLASPPPRSPTGECSLPVARIVTRRAGRSPKHSPENNRVRCVRGPQRHDACVLEQEGMWMDSKDGCQGAGQRRRLAPSATPGGCYHAGQAAPGSKVVPANMLCHLTMTSAENPTPPSAFLASTTPNSRRRRSLRERSSYVRQRDGEGA